MKYVVFLIIVLILSCKDNNKKDIQVEIMKGKSIKQDNRYPIEIIRQGLEKQYDKTKWILYCIHCDDTCRFAKSTGITDTVTFASLDLRLNSVEKFHDTTELNFYFYYHDTVKCDFKTIRNLKVTTGAAFRNRNDSALYYTSPTTMNRFWVKGATSRYVNPLQPMVIKYIKDNKEKLNPWFRNEAIKRGLLQ